MFEFEGEWFSGAAARAQAVGAGFPEASMVTQWVECSHGLVVARVNEVWVIVSEPS